MNRTMSTGQLANVGQWRYPASVPEKEGIRRGNLNITKAHRPRIAAFLRACVIASFQRAAVAGGFGLLGSFVSSFQPAICCPPRVETGRSVIATQRSQLQ